MKWIELSTLISTFVAVFLAEIGDKTQLITFSTSAAAEGKFSVFLGASCALILSTLLSVLLGQIVGTYVSIRVLEGVAGSFFVLMGLQMLYKAFLA